MSNGVATTAASTWRFKLGGLRWVPLGLLVILLDQATKAVVESRFELFDVKPILPFLEFTLLYNTGAAFSFLSDAGGWQKYFFVVLAIAISGLLGYWLTRTRRGDWRNALPYSLVIGGALGNVIDRLLHGHVVDFIQWHWRDHYWPAFNIADSAIVTGAIGIALFGLFSKDDRARK